VPTAHIEFVFPPGTGSGAEVPFPKMNPLVAETLGELPSTMDPTLPDGAEIVTLLLTRLFGNC